jgi:hypothetical protein
MRLGAGQAVDGVVVIVIAINHAVAHQVLFDGIEGGQPAWVLALTKRTNGISSIEPSRAVLPMCWTKCPRSSCQKFSQISE